MNLFTGVAGWRWLPVFALLLLSFGTRAQTVFSYSSTPGDYIGQGKTQAFTPDNATFALSGNGESIDISVNGNDGSWWSINLGAPAGTKLEPGYYVNAERTPFRTGRSAGVDVSGNGRGCNEIYAELGVRQVAFDGAGNIASFEASFIQRCESATAPPMAGVIRYKAAKLSLALDSDPGDYIGLGVDKSYYGDTSIFGLTGTSSYLQYSASGQRDWWYASIAAPTGQILKPGRYSIARFADSNHAGLDFFGDGRGCNTTTGVLDVKRVVIDQEGAVRKLYATFVQHCEGAGPALKGVIHYGL